MSHASPRSRHSRPLLAPSAALSLAFASAAVALAPGVAQAQVVDIKPARIEYEFAPSSSVHGIGPNAPDADARFQTARASLSMPLVLESGTVLLPGLRYQLFDVGQDAPGAPASESVEALHSLLLSFGVLQPLGGDFSLFAQLGGGIASQLSSELASEDWVLSAQALGMWNAGAGFTLGAGVGYDRRTGDVRPLPLVALNWEPRPDFLVRGIVPQFLSVRYRAAAPLTLALDAGLDGERYHLSPDSSGIADGEVAHSVIKAGPSVTLHWTSWFHTRLSGGAVLSRRFEVFDNDVSQGDLDVSHGPYAGLELWFGPSGWSSDAAEAALASAARSDGAD